MDKATMRGKTKLIAWAAGLWVASASGVCAAEILFPPPKTALTVGVAAISGRVQQENSKIYWQQIRPSGIQAYETASGSGGRFSFSVDLDPGVNRITVDGTLIELYYDNGAAPMPAGFFKRRAHASDISACEDCHDKFTGKLLDGGYPNVCLGCHVVSSQNPQNDEAPTQNSHFRTVTSNCGSCHEPHYSQSPKLLQSSKSAPCASCHQAKYAGKSAHPAYDEGTCAACHDTHYSGYPNNLHGFMPGVCQQCHDQAKNVPAVKFHPPSARDGKWCDECHDPHAATPKLLKAGTSAQACASCHPKVLKEGHGKDLESCGSCHDPHKAIDSGLLKKDFPAGCDECHDAKQYRAGRTIHPPVKEGCQACHDPHSADNRKAAIGQCLVCHNFEKDPELNALHGYLPMEIKDCLKCHPVHVSDQPRLVRKKTHFPLTQGKCDACHGTGNERNRKIADVQRQCDKCHSTIRDLQAKGGILHDPVTSGCTDCHDPHMSNNKAYLKQPQVKLCRECHDSVESEKGGRTLHPAVETCTDCHGPHGGENKKFLTQKLPKLCFDCHSDPAKKGKIVHSALSEGCTACHNEHAGFGKALLQKKMPALCFDCHEDPAKKGFPVHAALDEGCTACHAPHASDQKKLLSKPADTLCLGCHDDPRKGKANVHPAMDEGCTSCHNGHISKAGKLLMRPVNAVCADCHSGMKGHHSVKGSAAKDFPGGKFPTVGEELSCVGCHNPHASNDRKLFAKPEKTLCSSCH
jgi:predicted CXXCH cytochrome family protein